LSCDGNGDLTADLLLGSGPAPGWTALSCEKSVAVKLSAHQTYTLELAPVGETGRLVSVRYTLSITNWP
jgi:hypothetical protein